MMSVNELCCRNFLSLDPMIFTYVYSKCTNNRSYRMYSLKGVPFVNTTVIEEYINVISDKRHTGDAINVYIVNGEILQRMYEYIMPLRDSDSKYSNINDFIDTDITSCVQFDDISKYWSHIMMFSSVNLEAILYYYIIKVDPSICRKWFTKWFIEDYNTFIHSMVIYDKTRTSPSAKTIKQLFPKFKLNYNGNISEVLLRQFSKELLAKTKYNEFIDVSSQQEYLMLMLYYDRCLRYDIEVDDYGCLGCDLIESLSD